MSFFDAICTMADESLYTNYTKQFNYQRKTANDLILFAKKNNKSLSMKPATNITNNNKSNYYDEDEYKQEHKNNDTKNKLYQTNKINKSTQQKLKNIKALNYDTNDNKKYTDYVNVELDKVNVLKDGNKSYVSYVFKFIIGSKIHKFNTRYSELLLLHKSFIKNKIFETVFKNYNFPKFPSKHIMTDYTKSKNYNKRAQKLLKYFKLIISKRILLKNKLFQNGIKLPPDLKQLILLIANNDKLSFVQIKSYIQINTK